MTPSPLARRSLLLGAGAGLLGLPALVRAQDPTGGDPLGSMQWPGMRRQYLGDAPFAFSEQVRVRGPVFADDPMNVPLQIDARALVAQGGGIERLQVVVDRNPVREVLDFEPLRAWPMLALRIRLEQASPVRALVRTRDGRWHVGSTWVQAAGGGCTVPGVTRADGSWVRTLNRVQARQFPNVLEGSRRLRLQVMHPMDTGLVAGIPAFYLEQLSMLDGGGRPWWRLGLREPVSENPLLTFELPAEAPTGFRLLGQDNNGNRLDVELSA